MIQGRDLGSIVGETLYGVLGLLWDAVLFLLHGFRLHFVCVLLGFFNPVTCCFEQGFGPRLEHQDTAQSIGFWRAADCNYMRNMEQIGLLWPASSSRTSSHRIPKVSNSTLSKKHET